MTAGLVLNKSSRQHRVVCRQINARGSSKNRMKETPCNHFCSQGEKEATVTSMVQQGNSTPLRLLVLKGVLFGKTVSVLRDTNSNTLVVRWSLVPDSAVTSETAALRLANGKSVQVQDALVEIS